MSLYPPLKAIVAFDAAMRTHSFSAAAKELFVTPGAVGQQIQKLEEWLGITLFVRQVRQVVPIGDGIMYWQRIQPALAQILDASQSLKERGKRGVRLSMPPTFAAKWFTRRMTRLLATYPDVELRINSSSTLVDFERDQIDLAVRYFNGTDERLSATLLYQDEARAYCSPDYLGKTSVSSPDGLTRATLLHSAVQPYWAPWLRQFSRLSDSKIAAIPGIHFDQTLMAIEAAKRGQGFVIAGPMLLEDEISEKSLVEPFGLCLPVNAGYFVVHPSGSALNPATENLKAWLISEACENGRAALPAGNRNG